MDGIDDILIADFTGSTRPDPEPRLVNDCMNSSEKAIYHSCRLSVARFLSLLAFTNFYGFSTLHPLIIRLSTPNFRKLQHLLRTILTLVEKSV